MQEKIIARDKGELTITAEPEMSALTRKAAMPVYLKWNKTKVAKNSIGQARFSRFS